MSSDELHNLIHAYLNGDIDDDARDRLSEALATQHAARRTFWRLAEVDQALTHHYSHLDAAELTVAMDEWMAALMRQEAAADAAPNESTPTCPITPPTFNEAPLAPPALAEERPQELINLGALRVYRTVGRSRTAGHRWGRRLAAAMLVLAVGLAYAFWPARDAATPPPQVAQQTPDVTPTPTPSPEVSAQPTVARIEATVDAQSPDHALQAGDALRIGDSFTLSHGLVELVMRRGARVIVQGPCELTLVDDNSVRLAHGRLSAHVPTSAKFFAVETATARIVDLGTEFVIDASPHVTAFHVFTGNIEVHPRADGTRHMFDHGRGGSVAATGEIVEATDRGAAAHYWRQMPSVEQFRLITDDTLALWTFAAIDQPRQRGDVVADRARGGLDLSVQGDGQLQPLRDGDIAAVRFIGEHLTLRQDDENRALQFDRDDSFTLEAYIRVPTDNPHAAIIARDVGTFESSWWFRLEDGLLQFLICDGPNESKAIGKRPLNDGHWHHVAAVRDAEMREMRIYLNGVLEASKKDTTTGHLHSINPLLVGRFNGRKKEFGAYQFAGDLAFVRISRGALTSEQFYMRPGEWGNGASN